MQAWAVRAQIACNVQRLHARLPHIFEAEGFTELHALSK